MRENTALNKPVGIWIRVSTEDQAQGDSPAHHKERALTHAKTRGWLVKETYDLSGQSGKAVMQNPEAKRMMQDIKRGHISGLVFSKLARLSRNRRELEDFANFFDQHKADLISLSENIDTTTAGGRMFFHLLGVFAQWEREEITERVNASVLTRAKLGKSINGKAPYGYQWRDRQLVMQPDEAPVRRLAYELFLKCRRKGQVATHLNNAGYLTREGNIWRDTSILRLLEEPSAKGEYVFNTARDDGSWRKELKPESEWGRVQCPPIVSAELWNQANQIIAEQLKSFKKPGKPPVHLFSGLAHCGCGHKMYVAANSPKYFCRKCCNKIPITKLENVVRVHLHNNFNNPERIARQLQDADRRLAEKSELLEAHRRETQKVRDEMQKIRQLYLDEQISGDGFRDFNTPVEARKKALEAELPKLEAEAEQLRSNRPTPESVVQESNSIYERWPTMLPAEKREIVEGLIRKIIIISDGEIDVKYSKTPTSVEQCKNHHKLGSG